MRALGGTLRSPSGYISRSPFSSGSVLKAAGTSTGVPSNSRQGFQPVLGKPKMVEGLCTGSTSASTASTRSLPISPSIW